MAGKKDNCVVCVITNLTNNQANTILGEIGKAKNTIAPLGRATAAVTNREGVGGLLQKGIEMITCQTNQ